MRFTPEQFKSFPVRNQKETRGAKSKYPFKRMRVGDSRLFKGEGANASDCKAYAAAQKYALYNGKKFSGRKEPGKPGYVRIWRIE